MDAFECHNTFYTEPSYCIDCIIDLAFIFIILVSRINWIHTVMHDWYTAWESEPLKRQGYPRVEDKKYPNSADSDIYGDPNNNQF
jgi:hypothetical protein